MAGTTSVPKVGRAILARYGAPAACSQFTFAECGRSGFSLTRLADSQFVRLSLTYKIASDVGARFIKRQTFRRKFAAMGLSGARRRAFARVKSLPLQLSAARIACGKMPVAVVYVSATIAGG